jgi:4-phosphopantoate--beta-alanine ligase
MGKTVITIDLNPLSRTAQTADITIVDNIIRALPQMHQWIVQMKQQDRANLSAILNNWDNNENLKQVREFMAKRLNSLV